MSAPALRPSEFARLLDQMVREIKFEDVTAPREPQEIQP